MAAIPMLVRQNGINRKDWPPRVAELVNPGEIGDPALVIKWKSIKGGMAHQLLATQQVHAYLHTHTST